MSRRLPPLNALRAFEAAGRHLSMSKAAEELHVTPAAVSHQIKALEAYLGVALFRRLNRALRLTEAGQACLAGVTDGFDRLAEAMARLADDDAGGIVTVSATPSFTAKWLVPRIERFAAAEPDIDLRISASMEVIDFRRDEVDLAVRFGAGRYDGLVVEKLFDESFLPLCAPALLAGEHPLRAPEDLRHHTLLHVDSPQFAQVLAEWRMWLKAAGVTGVDATRGPHFSHADHAIQAAIEGAGVVLAQRSLTRDDIGQGRLVMPFPVTLPIALGYYLVMPPGGDRRAKVAAVRDWLLAEARRDEAPAG